MVSGVIAEPHQRALMSRLSAKPTRTIHRSQPPRRSKGKRRIMKRPYLSVAFFVLLALALLPNLAKADGCSCNDDCTSFLGSPACGSALESCLRCQIAAYWTLGGIVTECNLNSCPTGGGGKPGPFYPTVKLRDAGGVDSGCRLAAGAKTSYRSVRIEVYSARS